MKAIEKVRKIREGQSDSEPEVVVHTTTANQLREELWDKVMKGESAECPVCERMYKVSKPKLNSNMVYFLIQLWHRKGEWVHHTELKYGSRNYPHLRHFGLAEMKEKDEDDDTKKNSGYWRITEFGSDFVQGSTLSPDGVYILQNRVLGFTNEMISVQEALAEKFNYSELMKPAIPPKGTGFGATEQW
jgi:hypothetical protein